MPTYRITIIRTVNDTPMIGDKWHPSHDLEKVTAIYKKQALEALGASMINEVIVEMIDKDEKK